jgi:hypothetical protein
MVAMKLEWIKMSTAFGDRCGGGVPRREKYALRSIKISCVRPSHPRIRLWC